MVGSCHSTLGRRRVSQTLLVACPDTLLPFAGNRISCMLLKLSVMGSVQLSFHIDFDFLF